MRWLTKPCKTKTIKHVSKYSDRVAGKFRPIVELLEDRCLPSAGAFLQGFAYVGGSPFQDAGTGLDGATISLYKADMSFLASTISGSDGSPNSHGYYRFDNVNVPGGLSAGTYYLQESIAPSGY